MMWAIIAVSYFVVGLAAAGFTLAVFPPQTGYRPPLRWLTLAVLSYVVLWPFLEHDRTRLRHRSVVQPAGTKRPSVIRIRQRNRRLYRALYEETPT